MATPNSKHVVIISSWYPCHLRPFEGIFIKKIVHAIADRPGFRISHFSLHEHPGITSLLVEAEEVNASLTAYRLYLPPVRKPYKKLMQWLNVRKRIRDLATRATGKNGPISLVQGNILPYSGWIARDIARRHHAPYGFMEQYSIYLTGLFSTLPRWKRWLTRRVAAHADFSVAVSSALAQGLVRSLKINPPHIIPNIVLPQVKPIQSIPTSPLRIIAIGDLYPHKRMDLAIAAVINVLKNRTDVSFDIYGQGPEKNKLQAQIEAAGLPDHAIHLRGVVPNIEIYERLPTYHMLLIPSDVETFSVVGIEALASGVPVVATDCGGPADFIDSSNGMIVPKNNVEAMANGILTLAQKWPHLDRANMQKNALERFNPQRVGAQYEALYKQVWKHKP